MGPEESERFVRETLNPGALEAELTYRVDGEVRFDRGSRALYATDASNYRQIPIGVVIPRSKEAVVETLRICRSHGAPVVSRGGGTGLCGQTCNVAVVIDHSKYLNKVLELDPDGRRARVQPGTVLDTLRGMAEQHHLTFGPDPATHDHNTLGGMLGNNSCGIHSVMSGKTVDNVLSLEVTTYDGVTLRVGPTPGDELQAIIGQGGRRGEIYRRLADLAGRYEGLIRERYPRIPRRVSGYNLDQLLPENGFNVAGALVGTEGTCVTILEAELRLVHSPPARTLLLLGYPDVFTAGDHVPDLLAFKPVGLEGLDDLLIHFAKRKGLHPENLSLLPEGNGWLLAEFGGSDKREADEQARAAMEVLSRSHSPPTMKLFDNPDEERKIWQIRESGLGATANVPGMPLSWPGWEDAAVDPSRIGGYLREFRQLLDRHGLMASLYGHFGDGCIHCRISFDMFTHQGVSRFVHFIDHASDLVVKYGGSFSAEHGDGQSKAVFLEKMYGPDLLAAFREFKTIWDPDWKMNPGKVVLPYRPDQNLRLGPQYSPWQAETRFGFPRDKGSFSRATLRCVGVGSCRKPHDSFMCPSYLATREEQHTTRGRAHLLFEMFRGDFIRDGWKSTEVRDALDLCLSCKACRRECPVNVDMATYRAEFLYHHYRYRLRPMPAYTMGLIGIWGDIGSRMPGLANFMLHAPLLGDAAKALAGIAPERQLPRFAPETFTAWYHRAWKPLDSHRRVLLYADPFNDCFYPGTLVAAARVLHHYGYRVEVLDERPPAARPPLDYGMIGQAVRELRRIVQLLSPAVREGVPVVVLEPSTAALFRSELPELLPQNLDGSRLSGLTCLLAEFLADEKLEPPRLGGRVIFQPHCHQKAVLDVGASRTLFQKMGLHLEEPQTTCCGMAGSFGFEKKKYPLSMKIAEMGLLPAIRAAGDSARVVADGFSCRTQILDGTGRRALHTAELLAEALGLS